MKHNKFERTHVTYTPKQKPIKNAEDTFAQQKVTFDNSPLLFPPGMEKIFLVIYFMTLPYIAGLMFLYFYVGEGKKELFLSLTKDSSFILTWAIGYEILASLFLLYVIKMAISFTIENGKKGARKHFRIP